MLDSSTCDGCRESHFFEASWLLSSVCWFWLLINHKLCARSSSKYHFERWSNMQRGMFSRSSSLRRSFRSRRSILLRYPCSMNFVAVRSCWCFRFLRYRRSCVVVVLRVFKAKICLLKSEQKHHLNISRTGCCLQIFLGWRWEPRWQSWDSTFCTSARCDFIYTENQ